MPSTRACELAAIGEGLLELHDDGSGRARLAFGGDVLNTAVYAARRGASVSFVTALGDDHYSNWLLDAWQGEGVDCTLVRNVPGKSPSLYMIRNSPRGERHFHYWRKDSPYARLLDDRPFRVRLEGALSAARMVYVTGISLAMLAAADRETLLELVAASRARQALVAVDPNYRARLWPDARVAGRWIERLYDLADIALPSLDDHRAIYADSAADAALERTRRRGVAEVVVKCGADGYLVCGGDAPLHGRACPVDRTVDTTAAGDAFNAAYLVARLKGSPPQAAARSGAALAAQVVGHPGAIAPREAVPR